MPPLKDASAPWHAGNQLSLAFLSLLGLGGIVLSWWTVGGTAQTATQQGWLDVGVVALLVATTGDALFLLTGRRAVRSRERTLVLRMAALAGGDASTVEASADPAGGVVTAPRMSRYHRADCLLVRARRSAGDRWRRIASPGGVSAECAGREHPPLHRRRHHQRLDLRARRHRPGAHLQDQRNLQLRPRRGGGGGGLRLLRAAQPRRAALAAGGDALRAGLRPACGAGDRAARPRAGDGDPDREAGGHHRAAARHRGPGGGHLRLRGQGLPPVPADPDLQGGRCLRRRRPAHRRARRPARGGRALRLLPPQPHRRGHAGGGGTRPTCSA